MTHTYTHTHGQKPILVPCQPELPTSLQSELFFSFLFFFFSGMVISRQEAEESGEERRRETNSAHQREAHSSFLDLSFICICFLISFFFFFFALFLPQHHTFSLTSHAQNALSHILNLSQIVNQRFSSSVWPDEEMKVRYGILRWSLWVYPIVRSCWKPLCSILEPKTLSWRTPGRQSWLMERTWEL